MYDKLILLNNKWHSNVFFIALLSILLMSSCAPVEPSERRINVQLAEKRCLTYDCYMERIGRNKHENTLNEDGTQTVRWYMSVLKTRSLQYGEIARSQRNYKYYYEDCWFTATFDSDGNVLETEWEGPGCWGKGN